MLSMFMFFLKFLLSLSSFQFSVIADFFTTAFLQKGLAEILSVFCKVFAYVVLTFFTRTSCTEK